MMRLSWTVIESSGLLRLCRMRENNSELQNCSSHISCGNIALSKGNIQWSRAVRTPARLHYAISSVPLRTQPPCRLEVYQTSLIQYQKTYHNCHVEICFWSIIDISLHRWTNFCVRFLNFLHLLFSHHYHIF